MIELTIKGETTEELVNQAAGLLTVLVQGVLVAQQALSGSDGATAVGPLPEPPGAPTPAVEPPPAPDTTIPEFLDRRDEPTPAPKKRGRKKTETAEPAQTDLVEEVAKSYTLDGDIRPRLRALIAKKSAELTATRKPEDREPVEAQTTAFVVDNVFSKFGINKISELPAEQYGEFMGLTEGMI